MLLVGYQLKWVAYGSATLLLIYAITMALANGIKAPLDSSVFSAAMLAMLIGVSVPHARNADPN